MVFAYNMGGYDEFPLGVLIEEPDEYVFVRLPTASRNKNLSALFESIDHRKFASFGGNLQHPVETRIARYLHISNAYLGKQLPAIFVLHEEMREAFQHPTKLSAVRTEEDLVGTEYARHTVSGHTTVLENM